MYDIKIPSTQFQYETEIQKLTIELLDRFRNLPRSSTQKIRQISKMEEFETLLQYRMGSRISRYEEEVLISKIHNRLMDHY